jgi:hypothetical protein
MLKYHEMYIDNFFYLDVQYLALQKERQFLGKNPARTGQCRLFYFHRQAAPFNLVDTYGQPWLITRL